jgi:hypothetical protein
MYPLLHGCKSTEPVFKLSGDVRSSDDDYWMPVLDNLLVCLLMQI